MCFQVSKTCSLEKTFKKLEDASKSAVPWSIWISRNIYSETLAVSIGICLELLKTDAEVFLEGSHVQVPLLVFGLTALLLRLAKKGGISLKIVNAGMQTKKVDFNSCWAESFLDAWGCKHFVGQFS